MSTENYLKDLKEIKSLMHKSSRFISLSGLSGIMAGIYAIIGSALAYFLLKDRWVYLYNSNEINMSLMIRIIFIALAVAFLAIVTAVFLTVKKAKENNVKVWDETTKLLLFHFLIPLITGGIFSLLLLIQENFNLIAPVTLIFYGLALLNASKFTLDTVKYLGISEIILGLMATYFIGFGLYFWVFGFGVLHMIYGGIMYFKETKSS